MQLWGLGQVWCLSFVLRSGIRQLFSKEGNLGKICKLNWRLILEQGPEKQKNGEG